MFLPAHAHTHTLAYSTEDFTLDAEFEYDPMDDPEISAADKSGKLPW